MKEYKFEVKVVLENPVYLSDLKEYIRDAVKHWGGQHLEEPFHSTKFRKVTVKTIRGD